MLFFLGKPCFSGGCLLGYAEMLLSIRSMAFWVEIIDL